jgi:hypothetical protein
MDEVKASLIVTSLKVLCDQARSLQCSTATIDQGSSARPTRGIDDERHTREIITSMILNLEAAVLPIDEFGRWYYSLDELVLRSRRLAFSTQISHLQALIDDIQQHARSSDISPHAQYRIERWLEQAGMVSFLRAELVRIDGKWTRFRPSSKQPSLTAAQYILHLAGVGMAQSAIEKLGRDEAIAAFLRDGMYTDHVAARRHCELMLGILELDIDMLPDDLVTARQPMTSSASVSTSDA